MHRISIALLIIGLASCKARNPEYSGKKVLEFAIESKVGSLDPIRAASSYDHWAAAPVYESLFPIQLPRKAKSLRAKSSG